jgi:hypothetical protein
MSFSARVGKLWGINFKLGVCTKRKKLMKCCSLRHAEGQ